MNLKNEIHFWTNLCAYVSRTLELQLILNCKQRQQTFLLSE
jgi:hypothetical protein